MDLAQITQHLPRIISGAVSLAFIYALHRYKRRHDFNLWMQNVHRDALRAADDPDFRRQQLRDCDAVLDAPPPDDDPQPVTRRREVILRAFPRLMFILGGLAAAMAFLASTAPREKGSDWPVYLGSGMLLAVLCMYVAHRREQKRFARIQALNKKYLLQKTAKDAGLFETLRQILAYYPRLAPLWAELAMQYAEEGNVDKALETVREAQAKVENNLDLALAEGAFSLRKGDAENAEKALRKAESCPKENSDPRIAVFSAALALKKGDTEGARTFVEQVKTLDWAYARQAIPKEPALAELKTWMEKENLGDFATE